MAGDSTLDPDNLPILPDQSPGHGHGIGTLGPSDTSDSGSDMKGAKRGKTTGLQGETEIDGQLGLPASDGSTSDSQGTGDRASVEPGGDNTDGANIAADHAETSEPAK